MNFIKPVILITGAKGLVGSFLAEYILREGLGEVIGVSREQCDLLNPIAVQKLIAETRPDYLFHLAAQSHIPIAVENPFVTIQNNLVPAIHLLESVRKIGLHTRILLAGSSEEYGWVHPEELPIQETNPLRPLNPYAVSKVAMDLLGWQYFKKDGLLVIRTRSFNNLGPAVHKPDAANDWIRQVVQMERGLSKPVLKVGNLETKRDFVDVRDAVKAYWLALTRGEPGEVYNIASGKTVSLKKLLETIVGLSSVKIQVEQEAERLRPADISVHVGDYSKLNRQTGWQPTFAMEESLQYVFRFYRTTTNSDADCAKPET